MNRDTRYRLAGLFSGLLLVCSAAQAQTFDLVLSGGRVMDPESGYDAVANVGIRDGRIARVATETLDGRETVDVTGLVVAPGFVDLHSHGQSLEAQRYRARDGVTTALELEWGYPCVGAFLASRDGNSLLNYGASVSHGVLRSLVMLDEQEQAAMRTQLDDICGSPEPLIVVNSSLRESFGTPFDPERMPALRQAIVSGLEEGGLGIGMAVGYYPAATREEIFRIFELSAEKGAPIYTHVRSERMASVQEMVADAAATGAPLHVVHANSSSKSDLPVVLELIDGAREHGVDVTTESYPYTAGSTSIESALFDEGWQERLEISYDALQWQATGERLTEATFRKYRKQGGVVIIHDQKEEDIRRAIATPWVILASDAMPYAPGAHPRSAGTYARALSVYVRELGLLTLMEAIAKSSYLPAKRLESIAPMMARKGRLAEGADADLTLFDPDRVVDTATFESGPSFSEGIEHVLVAGTFVVRDGELVEGVRPGKAVVSRYR